MDNFTKKLHSDGHQLRENSETVLQEPVRGHRYRAQITARVANQSLTNQSLTSRPHLKNKSS